MKITIPWVTLCNEGKPKELIFSNRRPHSTALKVPHKEGDPRPKLEWLFINEEGQVEINDAKRKLDCHRLEEERKKNIEDLEYKKQAVEAAKKKLEELNLSETTKLEDIKTALDALKTIALNGERS